MCSSDLAFVKPNAFITAKDRFSIAVMKAFGFTNADIKAQYLSRAVFVLIAGIFLRRAKGADMLPGSPGGHVLAVQAPEEHHPVDDQHPHGQADQGQRRHEDATVGEAGLQIVVNLMQHTFFWKRGFRF